MVAQRQLSPKRNTPSVARKGGAISREFAGAAPLAGQMVWVNALGTKDHTNGHSFAIEDTPKTDMKHNITTDAHSIIRQFTSELKPGPEQVQRFAKPKTAFKLLGDNGILRISRAIMGIKDASTPTRFKEVAPQIKGRIERRRLSSQLFPNMNRWAGITPQSRVDIAKTRVRVQEIRNRSEFATNNSGLAAALRRRHEMNEVKFPEDYFLPMNTPSEELLDYARGYMKQNGITTKGKLGLLNRPLYERLRRKKLLHMLQFEPGRDATDLKSMNAAQRIAYAKHVIKEHGVNTRTKFRKLEPGLGNWLDKSVEGTMSRWVMVGLNKGEREYKWASLTPEKRLAEAKRLKGTDGITTKEGFEERYPGLTKHLRGDGTYDELDWDKRLGKWEAMDGNRFIEAIIAYMKANGMRTLGEVGQKIGVFRIAKEKGILAELNDSVKRFREGSRNTQAGGKTTVTGEAKSPSADPPLLLSR